MPAQTAEAKDHDVTGNNEDTQFKAVEDASVIIIWQVRDGGHAGVTAYRVVLVLVFSSEESQRLVKIAS